MIYSFRLLKENQRIAGVLAILEGIGAVVYSISGHTLNRRPYLPHTNFSDRFMVDYIKKLVADLYQEATFVAGTAGINSFEYFYREFQIEARLDPQAAKQLISQYEISYFCDIVEVARYRDCPDFVQCQQLRLTCLGRELFSSKRMLSIKDSRVRLFMPNADNPHCYVLYQFVALLDSALVYNNLLLLFRPEEMEVQQFGSKQLTWVIDTTSPLRYFYRQNNEEGYVHPCLGNYVEIEDIFYRGDQLDVKNVRVELSFIPENCDKQQFLRIAEALQNEVPFDYEFKTNLPTSNYVRDEVASLVSLDTDGEWHQFSEKASEFRNPCDQLNVKRAILTGQGLRPAFHTIWPYDEPESKTLQSIVMVEAGSQPYPLVSYTWRFPFMGMHSGCIRLGLNDFAIVGGSRICQLRRQLYLLLNDRFTKGFVNDKVVDRAQIKQLFALNRKQKIRQMKQLKATSYSFLGEEFLGWINTTILIDYSKHKIDRVFVKIGKRTGYMLPFEGLNGGCELYTYYDGPSVGQISVLEIVPQERVYLTNQLCAQFKRAEITYQSLHWAHQQLYSQSCRLLKEYLVTQKPPSHVTDEQYWMSPILRVLKQHRPTQQLMEFVCKQFEKETACYPIGVKLTPLFSSHLKDNQIMANTRLNRTVVMINTIRGISFLAVKHIKIEHDKEYFSRASSNYLVLSNKLRQAVGDQQVTLIVCPYLAKMLYSNSNEDFLHCPEDIQRDKRLATHKGHKTFVRKYFEEFGQDHPVPFRGRQQPQPWQRFLSKLPSEQPLPQKCSGQTTELLKWLDKTIEIYLDQARCSYHELLFCPINSEYAYHLRKRFVAKLTNPVRSQLTQLLSQKGDEYFKYQQFVGIALCIGCN